MGFWIQLKLLLWKNFTLRTRQKGRFLNEMIWPLLLFLILMWVRSRGLKSYIHECHFDAKALPSAGLLPFAQSLFCNFNNTCHPQIQEDGLEKRLPSFNFTLLTLAKEDILKLSSDITKSLSNEEVNMINQNMRAVSEMITVMTNPDRQLNGTLKLKNLVRDEEALHKKIASKKYLSPEILKRLSIAEVNVAFVNKLFDLKVQESGISSYFCNGSRVFEEIMHFSDPEAAIIFYHEICSLDSSKLYDLLSTVMFNLNTTNLLHQFGDLVNANSNTKATLEAGQSFYQKIWYSIDKVMNGESISNVWNLLSTIENLASNFAQKLKKMDGSVQVIESMLCGEDSPGIFSKVGEFNGGAPHLNELREQIKLRRKPENFSYHYDNSTTKECNDLFHMLESSEKTKFVFTQMKPYIRGKILYSPKNNAVDEIISEVNRTFNLVTRGKRLTLEWSRKILPVLHQYINPDMLQSAIMFFMKPDLLSNYPFIQNQIKSLVGKIMDISGITTLDLIRYSSIALKAQANIPYYLNVTDEIIHAVSIYLECFEEDRFEGYDSEQEVTGRALELISENRLWAGLIFTNIESNETTLPPYIRYKIRMDADKVDNTRRIEDRLRRPGPRRRAAIDLKYFTFGFAYLQDMIEHSIIRLQSNSSSTAGIYLKQFPYPCHIFDQFIMAISVSFPMFMVLAWVYNTSMIIKSCVYEKEQRLKEVMKVMGLGNAVHWVGWFIESFVMMFITIIMLDLILVYGKVLENSDPIVIFLFLLCFMLATITKSFMISTFFSRANVAAAAGGIIFFLLFLPYRFMFEWEERIDVRIKILTCLISNTAFGFGCSYLARYEEEGVGAQWHNLATSTIPGDNFSLAKCMFMMLVDSVLYAFITWYVEAVFPGMYGVPKRWYFFVQKSYWLGKEQSSDNREKLEEENTFDLQDCSKDFEKEPKHLPLGVCIENLRKMYGNKTAVDNLSLKFYEGQITSFLGHNGAGKTTTISILTGLFPPTSGSAKIYNLDIRKDIDSIRRSLGMCPQHNVLFHELTVMEHLKFYAQLKGLDEQLVIKESEQMIIDLGLPHKRDELAKNLSGGMQRKLSVAIAFVGGSRTVILDEPTAGVDPYSRRSIWELLLKYKKGRTIILTTHHMDEADLLGDRIAIIASGKLRCCGSSLFLKSLFGDGFYLTLVKSSNWGDSPVLFHKKNLQLSNLDDEIETDSFQADSSSDSSASSNRDSATSTSGYSEATSRENQVQLVTAFINSFCPGTKLMEDVGSELSYLLPVGDDKKNFKKLFQSLDANLENLRISSYGISDTALEEVFLKVANDGTNEDATLEKICETVEGMTEGGKYPTKLRTGSLQRQDFKSKIQQAFSINKSCKQDVFDDMAVRVGLTSGITEVNKSDGIVTENYKKISGWNLVWRQLWGIHIKRFHYARRNYKGLFTEIILPALFVLLAMLLTLIVPPKLEGPPLELTPWVYGPPNYIFFSNENPSSLYTNSCVNAMLKPPGIGARCMPGNPVTDKKCVPVKENLLSLIPKYNVSALPPESKKCKCTVGTLQCPEGAGGPAPPSVLTSTTDMVTNMTGRNISDWLLKSRKKYYKQRYGGFVFKETKLSSATLSRISEEVSQFFPNFSAILGNLSEYSQSLYSPKQAKVWFNNKGWVSSMAYMNTMNNILLRSKLPPDRDPRQYGISVINHPLNFTRLQLQDELLRKGGLSLLHAICVVFALSFVPASFILFLIEERTSNAKHLQFVSGVKPLEYWTANYFWDFCNYLIPSLMCIFIFLAFDEKAYVSADNFPGLVGLLVMYGWASIPLMYPASYIFSVPSSAFVALASTNLFIGIVTTVATFVLELFKEDQELQDISAVLRIVFLIFPHFCLGRGLIDMATNQLKTDALEKFGISMYRDPFEWDFLGRNLFSMLIQGTLYFTFTILIEYKFFCNRRESYYNSSMGAEDIDVANEREKVLSGQSKNSVLRLENLTKVYKKGKNPAVNKLCLSVKSGECFGLLGVNGAGKTSTFKMLTGDINATAGNAYLNGYSILTDIDQVRQNLGYCPQFDALLNLLTGREHLQFYARLRGVPSRYMDKEVQWAIDKLGLANHADKPAGTYSGGNKRKLSTALALIGSPPIVFLDEPTTGMDPKARRFLWNCILDILRDGRSVILTSHSMEECEALCTRLAIMVNGELKCLGSIQHLKNRFGQGYTLTIHVGGENPMLESVMNFINSTFQGAILKEQHHNQLQYQLPSSGITLSQMFHQMENERDRLNIIDYSLSQTTLDQVFINFAKQQKDIFEETFDADSDDCKSFGGGQNLDMISNHSEKQLERPQHIALGARDRETVV